MEFKFLLTKDLAVPEVLKLYREAGWWGKDDDPAVLPAMLSGSFRIAAAFAEERLIGMARALSDGVSDAYIQDVVVDAAYRRHGIGGGLVRMLTNELRQRGVSWIGLIGVPGTEKFYRKLGFSAMAGHVPMLFAEKE